MVTRTRILRTVRPLVKTHPNARSALKRVDDTVKLLRHTAAMLIPRIIAPAPEKLTVAITARCNLRCAGCRYGRDFMPNQQLRPDLVRQLLADAGACGFPTVRLYGGEPLLHPQLPQFVACALDHRIQPYVTTNGLLLGSRIGELYDAGLRNVTIGFYGTSDDYDNYVGRANAFARLESSLVSVRRQYGTKVELQINYLLTRQTCSTELLRRAWALVERYQLSFQVDLVHYSLPYFSEGPDGVLQFRDEDRSALERFADELVRLRIANADRIAEPITSIRSIPDWALKQRDMEIPCDAYKMLWIGADGTVQLCYASFPLGNLHHVRLRDLFGGPAHRDSCRSAFALECPRCHCERSSRIQSHLPSLVHYARGVGTPSDTGDPQLA